MGSLLDFAPLSACVHPEIESAPCTWSSNKTWLSQSQAMTPSLPPSLPHDCGLIRTLPHMRRAQLSRCRSQSQPAAARRSASTNPLNSLPPRRTATPILTGSFRGNLWGAAKRRLKAERDSITRLGREPARFLRC